MRTTIEMRSEHRAELLKLAAQRGEKGFSSLVAEALEAYLDGERQRKARRQSALRLRGTLSAKEAERLAGHVTQLREFWR